MQGDLYCTNMCVSLVVALYVKPVEICELWCALFAHILSLKRIIAKCVRRKWTQTFLL